MRTSGSFALKPLRGDGKPVTVNHNQCRIAQRADGYNYRPRLPALKDRVSVAQ